MDFFLLKSNALIAEQDLTTVRPLMSSIDWSDRLIGILGARGTGKTTLLLQRLKEQYGINKNAIYISLDDIYFADNRFIEVVEYLITKDIDTFFLDEVHKYPDWAREIKNLYDFRKKIRIVFTGSCITDILRQHADLSRRAVQYEMPGLSYREFLQFTGVTRFVSFTLTDILTKHVEIATSLTSQFKPLKHFRDYLEFGYYPFFIENKKTYPVRLEQIVKLTIENDMQFIEGFAPHNTRKIFQLFHILATNVPFKPNISKLSAKTGIHRNTLVQYIHYLEKARLINSLSATGKNISSLQKPDKIYLENTNLHFALSPENANKGSLREAFFLNQLKNSGHQVSLPQQGDFLIDHKHTFEIGGRDKTSSQVSNIKNSWVVNDDVETGVLHKIPLWLFGMLY